MPTLSLIFATINDGIATNLTVCQAIQQLELDNISYEIIIVDNGELEEDKENLRAFVNFHSDFPIKLVSCETKGSIPPNAYGMQFVTGKFVSMPEPHMVFSPHFYRDLLKFLAHKTVSTVAFGTFSVGRMGRKNDTYWAETYMDYPTPFCRSGTGVARTNGMSKKILAGGLGVFVCRSDWMRKIGCMFPRSFKVAGGFTAEHLMVGLTTWMFGGECWSVPWAFVQHPTYRFAKPSGRSAGTHLSMIVGAYLLGGDKAMEEALVTHGPFDEENCGIIKDMSERDRRYVVKSAVMTLDELVERWETLSI